MKYREFVETATAIYKKHRIGMPFYRTAGAANELDNRTIGRIVVDFPQFSPDGAGVHFYLKLQDDTGTILLESISERTTERTLKVFCEIYTKWESISGEINNQKKENRK